MATSVQEARSDMLVSKQCWKISISDGVGQDAWIASMSVSPAALVAFRPLSAPGRKRSVSPPIQYQTLPLCCLHRSDPAQQVLQAQGLRTTTKSFRLLRLSSALGRIKSESTRLDGQHARPVLEPLIECLNLARSQSQVSMQ